MLSHIIDFITEIIEIDCRQAQAIYGYNKLSVKEKENLFVERELDNIEIERNGK